MWLTATLVTGFGVGRLKGLTKIFYKKSAIKIYSLSAEDALYQSSVLYLIYVAPLPLSAWEGA